MIGIHGSRVVGMAEELIQEFTCGVCRLILTDPVFTPCCRQTYCRVCVTEWIKGHNTCPQDRYADLRLTEQMLITAPKMITNILNQLIIKCICHPLGCEGETKIDEMDSHLNVCDFNVCIVCDTKRGVVSEHNCIQNLFNKNNQLIQINKRLNEEIIELKEKVKN